MGADQFVVVMMLPSAVGQNGLFVPLGPTSFVRIGHQACTMRRSSGRTRSSTTTQTVLLSATPQSLGATRLRPITCASLIAEKHSPTKLIDKTNDLAAQSIGFTVSEIIATPDSKSTSRMAPNCKTQSRWIEIQ